jgi:hypothetical protein
LLNFFFDIKGIVRKEFILAGQAVSSTYYCAILKRLHEICEDFGLNFDDKRTGCCIMTMQCLTLPFSPGNFLPKAKWLLSPTHPTCLTWPIAASLFPANLTQLRWLRQSHSRCWTPSQNTTFRMHLKNVRSAWKSAYMRK